MTSITEPMTKQQIRHYIRTRKQQMLPEEIAALSAELEDAFCALPAFQDAECLFAYISFNQEVRTAGIIARALAAGKRVAVPKIRSDHLEFYYLDSLQHFRELEEGTYGIREPKDTWKRADGKEPEILMLMPGLAFDGTGTRVGYGKGYYDRYLARWSDISITKVALCYSFQMLDHIEADAFDRKADRVICAPCGRKEHV